MGGLSCEIVIGLDAKEVEESEEAEEKLRRRPWGKKRG
jgi:hypothetical protein